MIQNQGPKANLHDFDEYVVWRIFQDYLFDIGNSFALGRQTLRLWPPQVAGDFRSLERCPLSAAVETPHL